MLWILSGLAALFLAGSYVVYRMAFYNANDRDLTYSLLSGEDYDRYHPVMKSLIDLAVRIPYEAVYVKTYDGKTLFGRIYFQTPGAPFHIQFNGYKGNGIRDFSGGLRLSLEQGHNVLLVDQRSHGKSDGHLISYGIKERLDVPVWMDYLLNRYGKDTPIFLEGISMGAATVLMASDLKLPENLRGIFADCPYSSPLEIILEVAKEKVGFPKWLVPFLVSGAFLFGHFNLLETTAARSVAKAKVPITIIHGNGDHYVPIEMSRQIEAANPEQVTFVEVEGAPHGLSYVVDFETYKAAYLEHLNRC